MLRISFFLFVYFLSTVSFGQDKKFCGNWNGCGFWGISFYKIKRSQKIMWFSSGCTDRGTKHIGTWKNEEDTLILTFENRQVKYIYADEKLCFYSEDGNHGDVENGIPKSKRLTIQGAKNECRHKKRFRARKRFSTDDSINSSQADSTFVRQLINQELKQRDRKVKKPYPIFETAAFSIFPFPKDTIYTKLLFDKEVNWQSVELKTNFGYYTSNNTIDSCFHIHTPIFNSENDKFVLKFEMRFLNQTSYFITDYYIKRRGKWFFQKSLKSFSY